MKIRKSQSLLHFLGHREIGPRCGRVADLTSERSVRALLEEKATLPNKNLPCELSGQTRSTLLVAFSPDGTRLASTHCDHTVRITEIRTGKCTHILSGHPRTPWSIAYHPSSNDILATGCLAGEVRIWDLRGGGSEVWCTEENVSITSLAFHPVDQVLVIALANELLFWDWTQQSGPFTRCKTAHSYEKVRWVKFDPCGHRLLTGIANSATIHADEEDIGYIGDENTFNGNAVPRERRHFYQQQYRAIVDEINQRQRERVALPPYAPAAEMHHPPSARFLNALSTSRPLSLSPHHVASLNDARSFAQRTSNQTQRLSSSVNSLHGLLSESNPPPLAIPLEADPLAPQLHDPRVFSVPIVSEPAAEEPTASTSSSSSVPRCLSFDSLLRSQLTVPAVPASMTSEATPTLPSSSALSSSRSLSFRENSAIGAVTVVAGSSPGSTTTAPATSTAPRSTAFFNMGTTSSSSSGALRPQGGLLSLPSLASVTTTNSVSSRPSTGFLSTAASSSGAGEPPAPSLSGPHGPLCPSACRICTPLERFDRNSNALPTTPRHSLRLREMLVFPSRVSRSTSGSPLPSSSNAAAAAASASVPSRRQPHRLSSIIENEVRHTLDQVRSRRIDLSETLRDLDQLRHEMAAPRVPPPPPDRFDEEIEVTDWPDSRSMNENDDVDSMITEAGSRGSASSPASNVTGVDDSSRSSVAGDDPLDEESEMDTLSVGSNDSSALNEEPDLGTFGAYSAELENRVNELDQRVSEIQRRMNERLRVLSTDRTRCTNAAWNSRLQYQQITTQRRRDRFMRMRAHVDDLRSRYASRSMEARREREARAQPSTSSQESNLSSEIVTRRDRTLRLRAVHQDIQNMRQELSRQRQQYRDSERAWHRMQRRNLHPHYSSTILDEAVNNEGNDGIQAAVNRVIAGAYLASGGDISVANNIGNQTHRIQQWDFSKCLIPNISNSECNIVVPHCKIHNDANCDISRDGSLLATFVPSNRGFPDDTLLAVFSLMPDTLGQCLYTKSFAPNAISISLSPLNNYVLVGLASRRLTCPLNPKQMVAQVYKLVKPKAGEDSTDHICDIMHPCDSDIRAPVSINSARWLPGVGEGLVYGTNRGDLHIYRPGFEQEEKRSPAIGSGVGAGGSATAPDGSSLRRDLMQMLGLTMTHTTSTSTQTVHRVRRTASTQTDALGQHDDDH